MKKILVIGLGSMGRRRIRLIYSLWPDVQIVGVDLALERRTAAREEFNIETVETIEEGVAKIHPYVAFVCTSPVSHGKIVLECLDWGLNVFTEINLLSDWYDAAMAKAKENGVKLFISSTFMYRKEIEYVAEVVRGQKVNYIYHSGQYLPDWHPWESYKDFFVSDKRTNACREILAIEIPWLIYAFGEIESLAVLRSKSSSLDIDFCDNYMITIKHSGGNKGVFCQDIISRKGHRNLEVYSETLHLFWGGTPVTLEAYDILEQRQKPIMLYDAVEHKTGYNPNIVENAYRDEIIEFFDYLDGRVTPRHSFIADKKVLQLIDGIEGGRYDQ